MWLGQVILVHPVIGGLSCYHVPRVKGRHLKCRDIWWLLFTPMSCDEKQSRFPYSVKSKKRIGDRRQWQSASLAFIETSESSPLAFPKQTHPTLVSGALRGSGSSWVSAGESLKAKRKPGLAGTQLRSRGHKTGTRRT